MKSEMLEKARTCEGIRRSAAKAELPYFHMTGGTGWINDPNGFSVYRGEYHLFFQYYPYDVKWGPMHWGHAKTSDFVTWEFLPAALAPDRPYDHAGCFSGGASEMPDGRQLLLYTGVRKTEEDGTVREYQTQCAAVGDGVNYEKVPENPVIGPDQVPPGYSVRDFRDPKIWREDGKFLAVAAARTPEGYGCVQMYESPDGIRWTFRGITAENTGGAYGVMWECPDLFRLGGWDVLLHSVQEAEKGGPFLREGFSTLCRIGHLGEDGRFADRFVQTIDCGPDFYAPQTLETADGRRVMIAWMQDWAASKTTAEGLSFFGQMTFPRELEVRDGRLYQTPVREIEKLRSRPVRIQQVPVREEMRLSGVSGRAADLSVVLNGGGCCGGRFRIRFACGGDHYTELSVRLREQTVCLDRSHSGAPFAAGDRTEFPVSFRDGKLTLRLLLDRYSAEVFFNGGEQAASLTFYTPLQEDGITFRSDDTVWIDVEKYDLRRPT